MYTLFHDIPQAMKPHAKAAHSPAYGEPTAPQLLREGIEAERTRLVFAVGQRVRIARGHAEDSFDLMTPLIGQCGTVVLLKPGSVNWKCAWVQMDAPLPVAFRLFAGARVQWLKLWPEDCELIEERPA